MDRIDKETGEVIWDWYEVYTAHLWKSGMDEKDIQGSLDEISDLLAKVPLNVRNRIVTMLNSWSRDDFIGISGVMDVIKALWPK